MTDDQESRGPAEQEENASPTFSARLVVVLVAVAILAGLLAAKALTLRTPTAGDTAGTAGSLTSLHSDAMADYQSALATGRPIYVLFHSLTWQSCVEISAVADRVIPSYEGKIEFVNAISDDASSRQLAERLPFRYIPTSFFLSPEGDVVDSHTGPLTEQEMRQRLDALLVN